MSVSLAEEIKKREEINVPVEKEKKHRLSVDNPEKNENKNIAGSLGKIDETFILSTTVNNFTP